MRILLLLLFSSTLFSSMLLPLPLSAQTSAILPAPSLLPAAIVETVKLSDFKITPDQLPDGSGPSGTWTWTYTLTFSPAERTVIFLTVRSSLVSYDYLAKAFPPSIVAGHPNLVLTGMPALPRPLTDDDTMLIAYWTNES